MTSEWPYWLLCAVLYVAFGFVVVHWERDETAVSDPAIHLLLVALWPAVAILVGIRTLMDEAFESFDSPGDGPLAPRGHRHH